MEEVTFNQLLEAGVHFGHLKRKWNPKMAPYIFMERNGIHVIDLQKTAHKVNEARNALKQITKSGRKVLFVATKKQAKEIVAEALQGTSMPYITERWPGGMLTNFPTIKRTIKKMATIDKRFADGTYDKLAKRERLQIERQRAKLGKTFGSISNMNRPPAAIFIVDVSKEHIAVKEAQKLNIPIFGMVDTNSDPTQVDFPIPANDDASKSISFIVDKAVEAIKEGLEERKQEKEKEKASKEKKKEEKKEEKTEQKEQKSDGRKTRARKSTAKAKQEAPEQKEEKSGEKTAEEKPDSEEKNDAKSDE
ncbi:MAG: 30S ribosomal protein S2 [Bacteroidota bacterium]